MSTEDEMGLEFRKHHKNRAHLDINSRVIPRYIKKKHTQLLDGGIFRDFFYKYIGGMCCFMILGASTALI